MPLGASGGNARGERGEANGGSAKTATCLTDPATFAFPGSTGKTGEKVREKVREEVRGKVREEVRDKVREEVREKAREEVRYAPPISVGGELEKCTFQIQRLFGDVAP